MSAFRNYVSLLDCILDYSNIRAVNTPNQFDITKHSTMNV